MKNQILKKKNEVRAVPTTYCLQIKAFKRLLDRDKSENKETAQKEFAYIYHVIDPLSPYSTYEDETRKEEVEEAIFGEDSDWVEDADVRRAMNTYEELNLSEAQMLLKSAKESSKTLREYFEEVDLFEEDHNGKLKWKAKDLMKNLGQIGTVIEGIKDLEDQVEREMMDNQEIRGGVKPNKYNE